jgi:hypothetical protein
MTLSSGADGTHELSRPTFTAVLSPALGGDPLLSGTMKYAGFSMGVELWSWHFDEYTATGSVVFTATAGAVSVSSDPFLISSNWSRLLIQGLSVQNARVATDGHGWFDCNYKMGEAISTGVFMCGLTDTYRLQALAADEQAALEQQIELGKDYLLELWNNGKPIGGEGFIDHEWPDRDNYHNPTFLTPGKQTMHGFLGLLCYLEHKSSNSSNLVVDVPVAQAVNKTYAYLSTKGFFDPKHPGSWPEVEAYALFVMYQITAAPALLDAADRSLTTFLDTYLKGATSNFLTNKLRTETLGGWRGTLWFRALHGMIVAFPSHLSRDGWLQRARTIAADYETLLPVLNADGFCVLPMAPFELSAISKIPEDTPSGYPNAQFGAMAADAMLLAQVLAPSTNVSALQLIAANGLGWITGINPGISVIETTKCSAMPTRVDAVSASFIANGPGAHVLPWKSGDWGPQANPPTDMQCWDSLGGLKLMSIVNGFTVAGGKWKYTAAAGPTSIMGESYLHHDGMILSALAQSQNYYYPTTSRNHEI